MVGTTISHYRVIAELGSGGMGAVYEAEDLRLGRRVALKILTGDARRRPEALERFRREARIVSSLSHPHIAVLHDIGEEGGERFMVMELLEGESVKARLARGPLPPDTVAALGAEIADALDAAHAQGVVHRDIKPANLFITRRGQAKVLDFGVAKLSDTSGVLPETATAAPRPQRPPTARTPSEEALTTAGTTLGTVAYMSPEQARGEPVDARSDVFALGAVLFEMATGQPAFPGATPAVVFEGILTRPAPSASSLNPAVPPELDAAIQRALEKEPAARYQSAAEMRDALAGLRSDAGSGSARVGALAAPRLPKGRRALVWGAPLATVAIVGVALLWHSTRAPALTPRDTVVLMDFVNRTGDGMFDDTLAEALALQLRQSPFLTLLPDQQVRTALRLMGREPTTPISEEIGRDLCQRVGGKALLGGSIAGLGTSYVITLRAENCVTSSPLAEEQVQANSKEAVLGELGRAAASLREELGESLPSVQRYDAPIEEATTKSLEALKAYSQGISTRRTHGDFDSLPFFQRAIELDPGFALAHARLGTVLENLQRTDEAKAEATRAYELRERTSERERLYIEARYHTSVTRDVGKAIETYRLLMATYPTDYASHTNLGGIYMDAGRPERAIGEMQEAVRLAPNEPVSRVNLGFGYIMLGQYADARRALEEGLAFRDDVDMRMGLFIAATLSGDPAAADAQVQAVAGQRDAADMGVVTVQALAWRGRMREANARLDAWLRNARGTRHEAQAPQALLGMALANALWGDAGTARQRLAEAEGDGRLSADEARDVVALAAVLGDGALARAWRERAIALVRGVSLPEDVPARERVIEALAALANRNYDAARTRAESVGPAFATPESHYVLAVAAIAGGRWDEARTALEALLEDSASLVLSPLGPIARIRLAEVELGGGDTAAARAAFAEAFEHLDTADADLPVLVRAREEYRTTGPGGS